MMGDAMSETNEPTPMTLAEVDALTALCERVPPMTLTKNDSGTPALSWSNTPGYVDLVIYTEPIAEFVAVARNAMPELLAHGRASLASDGEGSEADKFDRKAVVQLVAYGIHGERIKGWGQIPSLTMAEKIVPSKPALPVAAPSEAGVEGMVEKGANALLALGVGKGDRIHARALARTVLSACDLDALPTPQPGHAGEIAKAAGILTELEQAHAEIATLETEVERLRALAESKLPGHAGEAAVSEQIAQIVAQAWDDAYAYAAEESRLSPPVPHLRVSGAEYATRVAIAIRTALASGAPGQAGVAARGHD